MSNWLLDFYTQNNKIVGKQTADGRIEFWDTMTWPERALHRQEVRGRDKTGRKILGELKGRMVEEKPNPVLVSAPSNQGLSSKDYRDSVKEYANTWREFNEKGKIHSALRK